VSRSKGGAGEVSPVSALRSAWAAIGKAKETTSRREMNDLIGNLGA
jgi:hypothetical protein